MWAIMRQTRWAVSISWKRVGVARGLGPGSLPAGNPVVDPTEPGSGSNRVLQGGSTVRRWVDAGFG